MFRTKTPRRPPGTPPQRTLGETHSSNPKALVFRRLRLTCIAVVAAAAPRPLKAIDKRHGIEGVPPYRKRLSYNIHSNGSVSGTTGRLLLTPQFMLLPILSLTPSRAIADALASPTKEQFRLSRTTTTCTFITTFLLFELLHHFVRDATNALNVRYSKDWTNGDASDEGYRRLPLLFLQERRTDILPFTATAQGVIFVFQRQWNRPFGQEFAVRAMLPRATPFHQNRQESLPGCNFITPQLHTKQVADDRQQHLLDLFHAVLIEGEYVRIGIERRCEMRDRGGG